MVVGNVVVLVVVVDVVVVVVVDVVVVVVVDVVVVVAVVVVVVVVVEVVVIGEIVVMATSIPSNFAKYMGEEEGPQSHKKEDVSAGTMELEDVRVGAQVGLKQTTRSNSMFCAGFNMILADSSCTSPSAMPYL